MKLNVSIIFLLFFLCSCEECGGDVNLGNFPLTTASREWIPYSGLDTLVFKDQQGARHILTSSNEREPKEADQMVRILCDPGFLSHQQIEFFSAQSEELVFSDSAGNQVLYASLMTLFEQPEDSDSIAIFDLLTVEAVVNGVVPGQINILTEERRGQVSVFHQTEVLNQSRAVGDTMLYGRPFKDVYIGQSETGSGIFYNKTQGLLALRFSESEFWVLEE